MREEKKWIGWVILEDEVPKSFHKFKDDAIRHCAGTRADNVKQVWIRRCKMEIKEYA